MAVADHNVMRRLLLGTAEAVPEAPQPDRQAWSIALAAFDRAEAEWNAFSAACRRARPLHSNAEAQAAEDETFGLRLDALQDAVKRLLLTPACDANALTLKIVLSVDYEIFSLISGEACLAAIKQDALRLCVGCSSVGS